MTYIRILVCRVDDAAVPDRMTELVAFDLPQPEVAALQNESTLDDLEASVLEVGHAAVRAALMAQWEAVDAHLAAAYLKRFPAGQVHRDGAKPLTVTSRVGTLRLVRQVVVHRDTGVHVMPGDAALPAHSGVLTLRSLQEWACLLAQDLPFATAARLLGWQTREDRILSSTTVRRLVRRHGALIRAADQETDSGSGDDYDASRPLPVVPHAAPCRRAGWPAYLTAAVEAALAHERPCPPRGIAWADWARVLEARRADAARPAENLRHLGPELENGQVLTMIDEVLTRGCERRQFLEVRTARIATPAGYRYVSGMGDAFQTQLRRLLVRAVAPGYSLLLIADCARWIRTLVADDLPPTKDKALLLDWYHLRVRCAEEASRACRRPDAKARFLRRLRCYLWRGDVHAALRVVDHQIPWARAGSTLAAFADYLWARRSYIPSYRDRWRACRYIGSGQLEKANDLLVARRQKGDARISGGMAAGIMAQTCLPEGAAMSRIRILVCRIDEGNPDQLTEIAAIDLPHFEPTALSAETALETLEATTIEVGHRVLRAALQAQWEEIDAHLVDAYCRPFKPGQLHRDGHRTITVASRLGVLYLPRQVVSHREGGTHVMPGDAALPAHGGMVITCGLQEWACLLAQDLPFATAGRLLGWQTQEEEILSPTTLRTLVRRHGALIRAADHATVESAAHRTDGSPATVSLVPHATTRRRAGWPAALTGAVEAALQHDQPCPPPGITWADWVRVLEARRRDPARSAADLRSLGPEVEERQVLVTMDEVLTRAPARQAFIELRTAYVATRDGYRYISGVGDAFLQHLCRVVAQVLTPGSSLLGIADCARWIRDFFSDDLAAIANKMLLLDWYHLRVRCAEEASRACRGRAAKARFLRRLRRRLWRGDVPGAVQVISEEVPQARPGSSLATFGEYLLARQEYIPDYRMRWRSCRYIGSGQVEKANDLLVARRQKGHGMHWSAAMSDALAAVRTLTLNREWEQYWHPEAPPALLAAAA